MKSFSPQQRLVLIVSILASFISFLDGFVVNVALPAIVRELGGGLVAQQWIVNAYLLTLGSLMLIAGSLSDIFGRVRILVFGLIGFGAASVLCAVAPNELFLIIGRGIQGAAGALLVPSSLALIVSSFSGSKQGKAIGIWTSWTVVASVMGPLLGGFLIDIASWRLIFAINILPILVTLWLIRSLKPVGEANENTRVDGIGALLCAIGLGGITYALIEQPNLGWFHPLIDSSLIIGIISFVSFLWYEKRTPHPMLPLSLFNNRNFAAGNIATVFIYGGLSLSTFIVTIFIQQIAGYSALAAGLTFLPVTVLMFTLSSYFGGLAGKYGPRFFMSVGPIVAGIGFLLMLMADNTVNYWTDLLPGILGFGLGLSITVAPLTSAILGSISSRQSGIGSAINNAVSRIAGLVAIATIGVIVGTSLNVQGFHAGLIFTAALLFTGGIISFFGIKNSLVASRPSDDQTTAQHTQ
ncbi:MAG TPA: MFS transporter [Candidatus Saccharimonadales bacterium]|nr:MFS transporter [Candidatus Saccharimonadales bacterium]